MTPDARRLYYAFQSDLFRDAPAWVEWNMEGGDHYWVFRGWCDLKKVRHPICRSWDKRRYNRIVPELVMLGLYREGPTDRDGEVLLPLSNPATRGA